MEKFYTWTVNAQWRAPTATYCMSESITVVAASAREALSEASKTFPFPTSASALVRGAEIV